MVVGYRHHCPKISKRQPTQFPENFDKPSKLCHRNISSVMFFNQRGAGVGRIGHNRAAILESKVKKLFFFLNLNYAPCENP
jgi:hypothetical protein